MGLQDRDWYWKALDEKQNGSGGADRARKRLDAQLFGEEYRKAFGSKRVWVRERVWPVALALALAFGGIWVGFGLFLRFWH